MTAFLVLLLLLSISVNVLLVWYIRKILNQVYFAAEAASEIFTLLDTYKEHLRTIYKLEAFYGDRDLKEVIEHTKFVIGTLKKYDGLYSFTQPELEEILKEEDIKEYEEQSDEDKGPTETIFHSRARTSNS